MIVENIPRRMAIIDQNKHGLPMSPASVALEKRLDGVLAGAALL